MRRFKGECAHFSFNKCPIYTHDGASAKFTTNSHETDNSVTSQRRVHLRLQPRPSDPEKSKNLVQCVPEPVERVARVVGHRQQGEEGPQLPSSEGPQLLHCKKMLSFFPSPAGMSRTKLTLDGNY